MKQSISIEKLCEGCPPEFVEYFEYCRYLEFKEKPDYSYLKNIINRVAHANGIDLFDKIYDWSVRAVTIKHFPEYYDFIEDQLSNPLKDDGKFASKDASTEAEIYSKAKEF